MSEQDIGELRSDVKHILLGVDRIEAKLEKHETKLEDHEKRLGVFESDRKTVFSISHVVYGICGAAFALLLASIPYFEKIAKLFI